MIQTKLEVKEKELLEEHSTHLLQYEERERELKTKLRKIEDDLTILQRIYETAQTELFEQRTRHDEEQAAKQREIDLLSVEVERANTRIVILEKDQDKLLVKLESDRTERQSQNIAELKQDTEQTSNIETEAEIDRLTEQLRTNIKELETRSTELQEAQENLKKKKGRKNKISTTRTEC